ncbi:antibiotic biosynthesis monooxygenase family protein [Streptomyces fuscigenes]|uniref:antibiotic biosynthesis monooxygenase family protein n=1 Tax=Streptomyces fuscigenes TaxID=1528880 RepID=UPI001F22C9CC|nr:antibiotic biosynthesis monooxygenase family protein [Streptomyces fuscigenes]MCF3964693.1 antibiotic biosynthesis monooxygenase [Streptomyces fuscigenes]
MITEIAIIDVKPGSEQAFIDAFRAVGHDLLATTPGCLEARMERSRETPTRFVGLTRWESVGAHLENFRGTDRYAKYRAVLAPTLSAAPRVEHFDDVMNAA